MSAFKLTISKLPDAVVATLAGPLTLEHSQALQRGLTELAATQPKLVYLDLSSLSFLPSQAMGYLVQFRNGLKPFGGRVVLVGTSRRIYDALRTARLNELFEFRDKLDTSPPRTPPASA